MSFSNTVTDIIPIGDGWIMEYGTFNGASVTTGTITASTVATYTAKAVISDVMTWGFANDADHEVKPARDVYNNQVKITFTTSDTGSYWIVGKAR